MLSFSIGYAGSLGQPARTRWQKFGKTASALWCFLPRLGPEPDVENIQWTFSCLIPRTLNQIPEPVPSLLGLLLLLLLWMLCLIVISTAVTHTQTALWVRLLHVTSFSSPNIYALLSGFAWAWAAAFYLFTLELVSVTFPPTQLALLLSLLTQLLARLWGGYKSKLFQLGRKTGNSIYNLPLHSVYLAGTCKVLLSWTQED